tara:strand:+ start:1147 stop:1914 length:768 start_codon:yes stop_codon:yes gene_type:complete
VCHSTLWSKHLKQQGQFVSNAILVASLESQPSQIVIDSREYLVVTANTVGNDGFEVVLRAPATQEGPANHLRNKKANDLILICGELSLFSKGDSGWKENHELDGKPIIRVSACCDATEQQFFNEVTLVGRFVGETKEAEKSCSRSVVVNRYKQKEQISDFFRIRGYKSSTPGRSSWGERIAKAPKGTLVEVNGMMTTEKSKDGSTYPVIKVRRMRVHKTGSGGSKADPAKEKAASGYEHSQFVADDDDQMPSSNW